MKGSRRRMLQKLILAFMIHVLKTNLLLLLRLKEQFHPLFSLFSFLHHCHVSSTPAEQFQSIFLTSVTNKHP